MEFCETMNFFNPKGAQFAVYKETKQKDGVRREQIYYFDDLDEAGIFFTRTANEYVHMYNKKKDILGYKTTNLFEPRVDTDKSNTIYGGQMFMTKDTQEAILTLVVVEKPEQFIRR